MHEQVAVAEFHAKHGFPIGVPPGQDPKNDMVRVHLIAEELAELALAIGEQNIVKIADALADLQYVVVGSAVHFGVPLEECFAEVHASNMTKAVRAPGDTRLRDKGASYREADIESVLLAAGQSMWLCCNARNDTAICTRHTGHKGVHRAHVPTGQVIKEWS